MLNFNFSQLFQHAEARHQRGRPDNPVRLISGKTSLVTHFLNFLASGLLLLKIKEYKPDSLIIFFSGLPRIPSLKVRVFFSSSSSDFRAFVGLVSPKTSHTSLATHHGVPSASAITLTLLLPVKKFRQKFLRYSFSRHE